MFPLIAVGLALSSIAAHGQATEMSAIPNGRPAINSGTDLVPESAVQIESGFSWSKDGHSSTLDGPESLMRIGLSNRTELQITLPDLNLPGVGFNDFALGVKIRVGSDTRKWPVAIVATVSLPTGSEALTTGGADPSLLLAVSHNLSRDVQLSGSLAIASSSAVDSGRTTTSQLAVDLGWCTNSDTCMFVEGAPFVAGGTDNFGFTTDAGMALRLAPHLPCDWRVGATLQSGGSTMFVSFGYSFRRIRTQERILPPVHRQKSLPRYRLEADSSPPRTP